MKERREYHDTYEKRGKSARHSKKTYTKRVLACVDLNSLLVLHDCKCPKRFFGGGFVGSKSQMFLLIIPRM